MDNKSSISIITAAGGRHGFGHLARCIRIVKNLDNNIVVYINYSKGIINYINDNFNSDRIKVVWYNGDYDLYNILDNLESSIVIVDIRCNKNRILKKLSRIRKKVVFDLFSAYKLDNSLIINTVPIFPNRQIINKNYVHAGYLYTPVEEKKHRKKNKNIKRILITFGGSDPYRFTEKVYNIVKDIIDEFKLELYIRGGLDFKNIKTENAKKIEGKICYEDYDLIITGFGVTVFEVLSLNIPVMILCYTNYHKKLSNIKISPVVPYNADYHLFNSSIVLYNDKLKKSKFRKTFYNVIRNKLFKNKGFIFSGTNKRVAGLIKKYINNDTVPLKNKDCPFCKSQNTEQLVAKINNRIIMCKKCRLKFSENRMGNLYLKNSSLFEDEYKARYNAKSYLKDEPNIRQLARERLDIIRNLEFEKGHILDIGCAYGFFLDEARKSGYRVEGIEPNKDAVDYSMKLKLSVKKKEISGLMTENKYDIITLWYVLEHLNNPFREIKKVVKALKENGLLAISVPNGMGFTSMFDSDGYIMSFPDDHKFDFNFKVLKKLFEMNNLKIIFKRAAGIHYERFKYKFLPFLSENAYMKLARNLFIGDTVEIYARKIR